MTDLRDRIVAVLESHSQHGEPNPLNNWCMCGSYNETAWREHVADAVIAALGARVQWLNDFYINTGQPPDDYTGPIRYVTDWQADE